MSEIVGVICLSDDMVLGQVRTNEEDILHGM